MALSPSSLAIPSELPSLPGREVKANNDSSVVGLSGLSELMRQQQGGARPSPATATAAPARAKPAETKGPSKAAAPAKAPSPPAPPVDPRLPKRQPIPTGRERTRSSSRRLEVVRRRGRVAAQRRRRHTLYAVIAAACGLIAVLGLVIYVMSQQEPAGATPGGDLAQPAPVPGNEAVTGSGTASADPAASVSPSDDENLPSKATRGSTTRTPAAPVRNPFRVNQSVDGEPDGAAGDPVSVP